MTMFFWSKYCLDGLEKGPMNPCITASLVIYKNGMTRLYHSKDLEYVSWMEMEMDHYWLRDCALKAFDRSANSFTEEVAKQCRYRLKQEIRKSFEEMSQPKLLNMFEQDQQQALTYLGNAISSVFLSPIPVVGSLYDRGKACVDEFTEKQESLNARNKAYERRRIRADLHDELD